MENLAVILNDIPKYILGFFIVLLGIKEVLAIKDWFCKRFGIETKATKEQKDLIETTRKQQEQIDQLIISSNQTLGDVKEIRKLLETHITEDKGNFVASARSTLYRLHEEYMRQKCVTPEQLRVFNDLCTRYTKCGGNDIVHEKLAPEVMALPICHEPLEIHDHAFPCDCPGARYDSDHYMNYDRRSSYEHFDGHAKECIYGDHHE